MHTIQSKTFKGGIHPPDNKQYTKSIKIQLMLPPKLLYFPVSQHIGKPAKPIVNVGDKVYMGQKIAECDGFVSANIHSSVSGTVTEIKPHLVASGAMINTIIIENDEKYTLNPNATPTKTLDELSKEEIINMIKEAGIVGMGGAGFPTHVKLSIPEGKSVDTVIINGAECEPYLTSDHRVMLEEPDNLIFGLKIIMKAVDAKNGVLAIESNKIDAIDTLKSYINYRNIKVVPLETKYPQGSEKQIINAVTSRKVPSGGLPLDVGVVVNNVDTCCAIARLVQCGIPLIKRIVTVTGGAIAGNKNYKVHLGTPVSYVIEQAGGFVKEPKKILLGGPMMGQSIYNLDVPCVKTTGAILGLTQDELGTEQDSECIRCGKCVTACPMGLEPLYLNAYAQKEDFDKLEKLRIFDCMECGACSYLCPGRQSPVQNIRIAKQKILQKRSEQRG